MMVYRFCVSSDAQSDDLYADFENSLIYAAYLRERDPERVLADVRSGYVSLEAARRDYGVVIRQSGRKFELDVAATQELRRAWESEKDFSLCSD